MDNPIKYENLFDADVIKGVKELEGELEKLRDGLLKMIKEAKDSAKAIENSTNPEKKKKEIEDLYEAYEKMGLEYQNIVTALKSMANSEKEVTISQKELNKVVKLSNEYQEERGDTYNNLSKQYSAMKILINNMTVAERENTDAGKRMVEQAKQIYEQMNMLQQKTGKFQLQVGNYSKALGGLNIATQQVIREMPVLANGIQMFVMAIGNNIPILVDQIQAFKKEQAELAKQGLATMSVGKAMLKTIFSWQTAIVALLTVLPMLIKKIREKKKAVEEMNKSLLEGVRYEEMFADVAKNSFTASSKAITELKVLYKIATDVNRSMEERISAGEKLKDLYPDEFENYSAEQIALKESASAYDELTSALVRQANARAYLDKITELSGKIWDIQKKKREKVEEKRIAEQERDKAAAKAVNRDVGSTPMFPGDIPVDVGERTVAGIEASKANKKVEELTGDIEELDKATQDAEDSIEELYNLISGFDFETKKKKKKKVKEEKEDEFDPYKLAVEAMEKGIEKELSMLDYRYFKEREKLYDRLELGEDVSQEEVLLEEKYQNEKNDVIFKYLDDEIEGKRKAWEKEKKERLKITKEEIEELKKLGKPKKEKEEKKRSPLLDLFMTQDAEDKDLRLYLRNIEKAFNLAFSYMQKWMDMRMEMARVATESAQREEDSAKHALDIEMEARANGYAHNVEFARKEYEEKRALKEQALAEEQRLAKIQQKLDEAQQMSSLLVATANIWAQYTKMSALGVVLAGIATATMWGSFASAKIQASQLVKTKNYGEGMSEYLDYGGSHASGNDIDFGTMKDGTRRRVERGEMVAVINKRSVAKYGVNGTKGVIDSLNDGTFNDNYGLAFAGLTATPNGADLSRVEKGIDTLVEQGEKKIVNNGDTTIEYYKNRKRIIKN